MHKDNNDLNEDQLRRQIQQKLEKDFQQQQERSNHLNGKANGDVQSKTNKMDMRALRQIVEWEVYSRFPEFVRCENHLFELRWLTPLELELEYEFYPVEENFYQRWKQKIFWKRQMRLLRKPSIQKTVDQLRQDIEQDVKERLDKYHQKLAEIREKRSSAPNKLIYQQEIDRFYRGKKGHKKYCNHLGDSKWMTLDEYQNQDEYFEEDINPRQVLINRLVVIAGILLFAFAGYQIFNFFLPRNNHKAYLIVRSNEERGHLYIDKNLAVGLRINTPYPVQAGDHEVSFIRAGYECIPKNHRFSIAVAETADIAFHLRPKLLQEMGVVSIDAPYLDANVYVDGEFQGSVEEQRSLLLPEGGHTIFLEKTNYIIKPPQHIVNLQAGDTVAISFKMSPKRDMPERADAALNEGLIEVNSNIKNADIFIDGQKTGFQTDYVLRKIPFGQHIITVSRKGYKVYPEERVVKLERNVRRVRADFTLSSSIKQITIETQPVSGSIFIDGKEVGVGHFPASLQLGKHAISFGEVLNYQQPSETSFVVSEDSPDRFVFNYRLHFFMTFSPEGVWPETPGAFIRKGYILNDANFRVDDQYGPETELHQKLSKKYWSLGYGFQYKNPPGNDGIEFHFNLPENLDLNEPVHLKLWIYQSKRDYPLIINGKSHYRIEINGRPFRKRLLPVFKANNMAEENYEAFMINNDLIHGQNKILISTTAQTSAFVNLWKVKIE